MNAGWFSTRFEHANDNDRRRRRGSGMKKLCKLVDCASRPASRYRPNSLRNIATTCRKSRNSGMWPDPLAERTSLVRRTEAKPEPASSGSATGRASSSTTRRAAGKKAHSRRESSLSLNEKHPFSSATNVPPREEGPTFRHRVHRLGVTFRRTRPCDAPLNGCQYLPSTARMRDA